MDLLLRRARALALPLSLLALAAGGAIGCGAADDTRRERLEASIVDVVSQELSDEGSYSTAETARCGSGGPTTRCDVGVVVSSAEGAFEEAYRVTVDGSGCWRALREGLLAAGGLDAEHAPPRTARGCIG